MIRTVIMAGGHGTRLRPLTSIRPKPMVPIVNKPALEHTIKLLKKYDIDDIIISLCYLPENVQNYFGDGSDWDVKITYSVEENPLGTAGGVKNADTINTITKAYLNLEISVCGVSKPIFVKTNEIMVSSKTIPNARLSLIKKERYSFVLNNASILSPAN